jgi:hypothetical protein
MDDRERKKRVKDGAIFLLTLVKEAQADPKTDDPGSLKRTAILRYRASAFDTCVWCGVDPARGRTFLCPACNTYRRDQGRPPTEKAVDTRRDGRVEAGAEANRP